MMLSAEKTSSSSTPDLWTTVKSALPFGMGQSSPPPLDDSPGTASSPTSPQPQVGPNNGPDVVDDTLSTMQVSGGCDLCEVDLPWQHCVMSNF